MFFLSHTRDDNPLHFPSSEMLLQPGDRVRVQTEPQTLKLIHQWNRDKEPY